MTTSLEDQVRAAFAFRAEHTETTADRVLAVRDASQRRVDLSARRPRRWSALALTAAAVIAAGVVGAVVQRAGDHHPEPTVPADANPVFPIIADPLAISLDGVPRSIPTASGLRYDVLDVEEMTGAGWTVTDDHAYAVLGTDDTPAAFYQYAATLKSPEGQRFSLSIRRVALIAAPGPSDTRVDVAGAPGWITSDSPLPMISWSRGDVEVDLTALRSELSHEALITAATAIRFAEVDELSAGDRVSSVDDRVTETAADEAVLGGTLDGVPWVAEADPGALRTIRVATPADGSAMASSRLSQPTDDPVTDVEVSITGVPGHGAIAYGWVPPEATAVRPMVDGALVGEFALYRRSAEAFFAVPIPDGVVVSRLIFVDDAGEEVASSDLPPIPVGLDGNYTFG